MLHFYKFSDEVPSLVPASETYHQRAPGKGWPEECPPLRAANGFGWDVRAAFDMHFRQEAGEWRLENPKDLESDWSYNGVAAGEGEPQGEGVPLVQRNAWFWEDEQELPHRISPDVYQKIRNQVKVSTYHFVYTDQNELLYLTDIPNRGRPFRALSALLETDWYPASYPWHCVLELDSDRDEVRIDQGEPLCRLFLVRRDSYFAQEMSTAEFERYFQRGQEWLGQYGRREQHGMKDITRTYVKQQRRATFSVII